MVQPKFLSNANLFGPGVDKWAKTKGILSDAGDVIVLKAASNLSDVTDKVAARTHLGISIGTDVQPFSTTLSLYAGNAPPSIFTLSLLDQSTSAAWRQKLGLNNVENTKDIDKPISTAVQTALDEKADKTVATTLEDGLMSAGDKIKLYGLISSSGGGAARFDAPYAATWIIPHGFNHRPMVQTFLSSGEEIMADVVSDETYITVTFAQPTQGYVLAY